MTNSQMNGERMSNEMPRDQTTSKQMTNSDQMKLTDCKKQLLYELAWKHLAFLYDFEKGYTIRTVKPKTIVVESKLTFGKHSTSVHMRESSPLGAGQHSDVTSGEISLTP